MSIGKHYHVISPEHPASLTYFDNKFETEPFKTVEYDSASKLFRLFMGAPLLRNEKGEVPIFTPGFCDGPRKKRNIKGPLLLILDVDDPEAPPLEELSERLSFMEVDHVIY